MRETITIECETNDFKAKALRWADENCHGDSMAKMAKKVSAEFGIEIKRRTWNSSKLTSLNTKSVIDAEKITEIELADSVYGETLESEYKSF